MPSSSGSKTPSSFADGVNAAMQDLAAAMSAPDADLHFGTEMIKVMGTFLQAQHQPVSQPGPGGAAGRGGGAPPGVGSLPGGPAGGGAANPAQPNVTAPPSGPPPEPGSGPTPGLTMSGAGNNPDEMRRVLQEVAGQ